MSSCDMPGRINLKLSLRQNHLQYWYLYLSLRIYYCLCGRSLPDGVVWINCGTFLVVRYYYCDGSVDELLDVPLDWYSTCGVLVPFSGVVLVSVLDRVAAVLVL
jgi:hypothetical protein